MHSKIEMEPGTTKDDSDNPSVELGIFHGRHGFKECMKCSCSGEPAMLAKAQSSCQAKTTKKIRLKPAHSIRHPRKILRTVPSEKGSIDD